ncbi:MAG: lipopolysaccharide kinase InaA family protein [Phycisphaeraceae bacterium]
MSTPPSPFKPCRVAGWRGYVREDWIERARADDPLTWWRQWPSQLVRDRATAQTWCAQTEHGRFYVKHVRALKDDPRKGHGWWDDLRWAVGPSRAARVARVTRQLERAGIAVPAIVLALRRRQAGSAEELLVSEAAIGHPLGKTLRDPGPLDTSRQALLETLGRSLAALHQAGFTHGDLNPTNVLLSLDLARLIYLDNERTRRWWPRPPAKLRRRNLAQMLYRLLPALDYREAQRFLDSYWQAMDIEGKKRRREHLRVLRWVRLRFQQRRRPYARHQR